MGKAKAKEMFGGSEIEKGQLMTDEQIKTWSDAAQAQLKVQQEAMKAGTFVPGMGGMRGGHGGHVWRGSAAPSTSTTPTASNSTVN